MNDQIINQRTDRALFVWLLLAGSIGSLIGAPWSIAILQDSATVWLSVVVEILLLAAASAVGVWLGKRVGLGASLKELVSGNLKNLVSVRAGLLPAVLVGLILGGIGYFAQNSIPKSVLMPSMENPNSFEWFLRCLSAAFTEEIFFRFGLMTFFVWLVRSIIKKPDFAVPSVWIGNLLSALVFAGMHLPQLTFHSWNLLIPFVMVSSSAGLILGWLFMRYGLISAIICHFIVDFIVYVVPRWIALIL
jgi:hypothetical protein